MKVLLHKASITCVVNAFILTLPYSQREFALGVRRRQIKNVVCLTYLLTACTRVLLEKLTGFQIAKKFPAFYGTRRFITVLTSARHLSLSWASYVQPIRPHPTSWRSILIVSSLLRLGLPSRLFPSGIPTKILYTPLLCSMRATWRTHLIILDLFIRTILVRSTDHYRWLADPRTEVPFRSAQDVSLYFRCPEWLWGSPRCLINRMKFPRR